MKWLALVWAVWAAWIPVAFFFGRLFCRYACPLGLSQSFVNWLFHPRSHVRRVCTRLPRSPFQHCINIAVLLAYFTLPIGCLVHPWGIFGRVMVLFAPGILFFAAILATATMGKGRFWCNWICPLGTMFDFVARIGIHSDKIGRNCSHCRACFPKAAETTSPGCASAGNTTRRETIRGVALLAVADKLTDGGFAEVSQHVRPADTARPLPPGAVNRDRFANLCVGCGLCAAKCPGECLVTSSSLSSLGRPEMDFRRGYCLASCSKCGDVCPVAALRNMPTDQRSKVHIGKAIWRRNLCIRETEGVECKACERKCPTRAIKLVDGFPVVDTAKCIGCGACEHVCPARPEPAIYIEGYDVQKIG